MAEPRNNLGRGLLAAGVIVVSLVAWFVYLEVRGPRPASGPAPQVHLMVTAAGSTKLLERGAKLSPNAVLIPRVTLPRATRVSLVHIDVGHGLEALVLNQRMSAGEHAFDVDGGAVEVQLEEMSGPQQLAVIAADRDLTQDEALSAGRGTLVPATGVASYSFSVLPQ